MTYYGCLTKEELVAMVDEVFPYVPKPPDEELMRFGDEDLVCRFLKEHMEVYCEPKLPAEGVRYLHNELANLSPKGMWWVLPSLVRAATHCRDKYDTLTDCLIYDLEADENRVESVRLRYSLLNRAQLRCLHHVVEYLSEQHGHHAASALETLEKFGA